MLKKLEELPLLSLLIPYDTLKWKGRYVDNGYLSNFSKIEQPILYRGEEFHSTECVYMASKNPLHLVNGVPLYKALHNATPSKAKFMVGRRSGTPLRENWDLMEVSAMAHAICLKFHSESPELRWLMSQPEHTLVEWTTWGDRRWGVSFKNHTDTIAKGCNALGLLLILRKRGILKNVVNEDEWINYQPELLKDMEKVSRELFVTPTQQPDLLALSHAFDGDKELEEPSKRVTPVRIRHLNIVPRHKPITP